MYYDLKQDKYIPIPIKTQIFGSKIKLFTSIFYEKWCDSIFIRLLCKKT